MNQHNDDDVKLMSWLMNGANHGTIDVCGENVSSMRPVHDRRRGIRLLRSNTVDNHSKLLKMELGQQIPIKSPHKMKRDVMKRVKSLNPTLAPRNLDQGSCWYDDKIMQSSSSCGPLEYSFPNSKWGFFNECVTQRFFDRDPDAGTLIQYGDENNQAFESGHLRS